MVYYTVDQHINKFHKSRFDIYPFSRIFTSFAHWKASLRLWWTNGHVFYVDVKRSSSLSFVSSPLSLDSLASLRSHFSPIAIVMIFFSFYITEYYRNNKYNLIQQNFASIHAGWNVRVPVVQQLCVQ